MGEVRKRPQVIRDLIDAATYIAQYNLDKSDDFLRAAEETFKQLAQHPYSGKACQFEEPRLDGFRQIAIKRFRRYLIFYLPIATGVEIVRILHGAQDLESILEDAL